jgi:hypothetical protein
MKRSDTRILTSHVGSLPRPDMLIEINRAKFAGEAYDESVFTTRLAAAVGDVCRQQAEIGIDVINDGEFGKTTSGPIDYGAWSSYAWDASVAGSPATRAVSPHSPGDGIGSNLPSSIASWTRRAFAPRVRSAADRRCSPAQSPMSASRR